MLEGDNVTVAFDAARASITAKITALEAAKVGLVAYLRMKITVEDWHGVADAAMDLRELDAALAVWRSL